MGSVHLRKFNVTDKEMYKNSAKSQSERREEKRRKKRLHIEPLLEQFSKRKFIFVGDSGEEDPEVYAQLARKYPGQVIIMCSAPPPPPMYIFNHFPYR